MISLSRFLYRKERNRVQFELSRMLSPAGTTLDCPLEVYSPAAKAAG
jgi:hypothetical protein